MIDDRWVQIMNRTDCEDNNGDATDTTFSHKNVRDATLILARI